MTGRRILALVPPVVFALVLWDRGPAEAQQQGNASARTLLQPFAGKTLAGEVLSVDAGNRTVVIRVTEEGRQARDVPIALNDRTVLGKLRTPISGGDLTPGHLVRVKYRDHKGRLIAQRIEVTGKAVHPPMP